MSAMEEVSTDYESPGEWHFKSLAVAKEKDGGGGGEEEGEEEEEIQKTPDMEQQELSFVAGRNAKWYNDIGTVWRFLTGLNIRLP